MLDAVRGAKRITSCELAVDLGNSYEAGSLDDERRKLRKEKESRLFALIRQNEIANLEDPALRSARTKPRSHRRVVNSGTPSPREATQTYLSHDRQGKRIDMGSGALHHMKD